MKPLTPAMIEALRLYGGKRLFYSSNYMHNRLYALRLIRPAIGEGWTLTPAGRRVLAAHYDRR